MNIYIVPSKHGDIMKFLKILLIISVISGCATVGQGDRKDPVADDNKTLWWVLGAIALVAAASSSSSSTDCFEDRGEGLTQVPC